MYLFYQNSKMKYEIKLIFQISFSINVKRALTQVKTYEQKAFELMLRFIFFFLYQRNVNVKSLSCV